MKEMMYVLEPLFITLLLECTGGYMLGMRRRSDQYLIILLNCVTNPVLVLTSMLLMYNTGIKTGMILTYAVLEPLVIWFEGKQYSRASVRVMDPWGLSLLLNVFSVLGGLLWRSFL